MSTSYVRSGFSKRFALIERPCTDETVIALGVEEYSGMELFVKEFLEMLTLSKPLI